MVITMESNYQKLGTGFVITLIGIYAVVSLRDGLYVLIGGAIMLIVGLVLIMGSRQEIRYMLQDLRGMMQ